MGEKDKNKDKNKKNKDPNENQEKGKEKIDDRKDDDPTKDEEPTPPPRKTTPPTWADCDQGYSGVDCDECVDGYSMLNGVCTKLPEVGCYTPGTHSVTRSKCNCKPGCEGPGLVVVKCLWLKFVIVHLNMRVTHASCAQKIMKEKTTGIVSLWTICSN